METSNCFPLASHRMLHRISVGLFAVAGGEARVSSAIFRLAVRDCGIEFPWEKKSHSQTTEQHEMHSNLKQKYMSVGRYLSKKSVGTTRNFSPLWMIPGIVLLLHGDFVGVGSFSICTTFHFWSSACMSFRLIPKKLLSSQAGCKWNLSAAKWCYSHTKGPERTSSRNSYPGFGTYKPLLWAQSTVSFGHGKKPQISSTNFLTSSLQKRPTQKRLVPHSLTTNRKLQLIVTCLVAGVIKKKKNTPWLVVLLDLSMRHSVWFRTRGFVKLSPNRTVATSNLRPRWCIFPSVCTIHFRQRWWTCLHYIAKVLCGFSFPFCENVHCLQSVTCFVHHAQKERTYD